MPNRIIDREPPRETQNADEFRKHKEEVNRFSGRYRKYTGKWDKERLAEIEKQMKGEPDE